MKVKGMNKCYDVEVKKMQFEGKETPVFGKNSKVHIHNIRESEAYKLGRKEALISEIKWLEIQLERVRSFRKNVAGLQILEFPIQERIAELKGALE